jgi:hypothetical protein
MSDGLRDDDPGELDPEVLARLQALLLEAAPAPASGAEWDGLLAGALAADAPADAVDLVPDQTAWAEPIFEPDGDAVAVEPDGDGDGREDGGWRDDGWVTDDVGAAHDDGGDVDEGLDGTDDA